MDNKTISKNPFYPKLALASGYFSAFAGLLVLAGWLFGINFLKTFYLSSVPMKPNPAVAFIFAGLSLILLNLKNGSNTTIIIAKIFAAFVIWIGLLTLLEYLLNINFNIDQLLFHDTPGAVLTVIPGRMSFNLALGLTSSGIALLSISLRNDFAKGLALLSICIGTLAVISYLLSLTLLLTLVGVNTIALNSAVCLLILSVGVYFSVPKREQIRSKLETQSMVAFIVIALILIASNVLFIFLQNKVVRLDKRVADINTVIEKIDNSLFFASYIESNSRGYVITGDTTFLQMFAKSKSELLASLEKLNTLTLDYPAKQYFTVLQSLIVEKIAYNEGTISIRMNNGLQPAVERISSKKGKILMDNIRENAEKMKLSEFDSYNKNHDQELALDRETNSLQAIFMLVLFGFLIVIYFNIARDISARTKAEASLKENEEKFRSISQSAADAIISADSKGLIIGWNKGAENIFGYLEDEIMGEKLIKIIPEQLLAQHTEAMHRVQTDSRNKVSGNKVELIGLHKNGNQFPIELSLAEWESSSGKYFSGIIRDITNRKQLDLERRIIYEITEGITTTSNLDDFLKLMHASLSKRLYTENIFVALYDKDTGLFSFPYFVDKFDAPPPPSLLLKSCTAYVFRTQKSLLLELKDFNDLVDKKEVELIGSPSPSWIGIPLHTPDGYIGVLVLQHYGKEHIYTQNDIGFLESIGSQIALAIERKLSEEEIRRNNEKLILLNAEKDKLFSIIAHDLKSPFNGLVNLTELMSDKSETFTIDEYLQYSRELNDSARNIYKLIDNLFEWVQLQKGSIQFTPVLLNLQTIASQQIVSQILNAKKKNINIVNNVPEELNLTADANMLGTILRNLISNAVKFTVPGGMVTVNAESADNGTICFSVSDTGIGMSPDLVSKLFKIGEKVGAQGTAGEPSTGLGLLICKDFVEKHKGTICVHSEMGIGSVFTIILPA